MSVQPVVNYQTAIPQNSYYIDDKIKDAVYKKDDHIVDVSSPRVFADKLSKNTIYAIKGLKGSKNSNFYESLSLGIVPYLLGSVTLIALFNLLNKTLPNRDKFFAKKTGVAFGLGVIMYGIMKVLGEQFIDKGVQATTGVDLGMHYKKVVHNLPEFPNDPNLKSEEYHKVFESMDFPYWQMLEKKGAREGDRYKYYDKMAKRMGYKEKLNSPDQATQPAILEVATKATAIKNVVPFIWGATGVALAFQPALEDFLQYLENNKVPKGRKKPNLWKDGNLLHQLSECAKKMFKQLWTGEVKATDSKIRISKSASIVGKILVISSIASALFGIIIAKAGFRKEKEVTCVDFKKDYKEC